MIKDTLKNKQKQIKLDLANYEDACNDLLKTFIRKYFLSDGLKHDELEYWWVADRIGEVAFINDYFFNMTDIVDFLRCKYTRDEMSAYYEYSLKFQERNLGTDKKPKNITHWLSLKKNKKKK